MNIAKFLQKVFCVEQFRWLFLFMVILSNRHYIIRLKFVRIIYSFTYSLFILDKYNKFTVCQKKRLDIRKIKNFEASIKNITKTVKEIRLTLFLYLR